MSERFVIRCYVLMFSLSVFVVIASSVVVGIFPHLAG